MRFNVDDYEMVQDRIVRFQEKYPKGAIINEVIETSEDGKRLLVKCSVYRDVKDSTPAGVDIAMDWQGKDSGATRTNWAETSATSATGRALSLVLGYKGKGRSSAEEMMIANERLSQPVKEVKKPVVKKTTKQEVKEVKEPEGMSGEDRKKQELWGHVKELKVEYEKQMIQLNPDIDKEDSRMKFPSTVYNNMEKCLDTLGWKKYEVKWEQWLGIHNHFNAQKLEKREIPVPIESEEVNLENILNDLGVEGTITEGDLPPVDMEEHFSEFPKLDMNLDFQYKIKPISEKQMNWINGLARKNGIDEEKLGSWILHNFKKTFGALNTKEASIIISGFNS